jgi:hypothetical protein
MYAEDVRRYYIDAVDKLDIPSDLRQALRANERVPQFVIKMAHEFKEAQEIRLRRGKPFFTQEQLKDVVYDYTKVFCKMLQTNYERMVENEHTRLAREAKASYKKDLENTINGKPTGEFEGVFIEDNGEVK